MDAVITYVNGLDPLWQKDYEKYGNAPVLEKRFRDWGTLKYLLRGIEKNMPFINNVFLVVARDSQVPEWVDRDVLKVVLHRDIIPEQHLPTFNSTTIEMFLHKIPGLDEQYLYFNDDMFPICPCKEDDFFVDGKISMGFSTHLFSSGLYKTQCKNSDRMALKALGRKQGITFKRPQHNCSPMLRSYCEQAYMQMEKEILASISRFRTYSNLCQYFFLDYILYSGKAIVRRIPAKFFSLAISSAGQISSYIENPAKKLICINDVRVSESQFSYIQENLQKAFGKRFPDKSRFEK